MGQYLKPHQYPRIMNRLRIYDDELTGHHRVLCDACIQSWEENSLDVPKLLGPLNDLAQACCACENCVIRLASEQPQRTYFDKQGTLRNQDGSRSIFDDVDK